MADVEKLNIEKNAWWAEGAKKEYEDTLKGKEFGKKETEDERQQAAKLLEQIQWVQTKEGKKVQHEKEYVKKWRQQGGEQRKSEHPGEANEKRYEAGKSIPEELKTPQKGVGKFFQNVSRRILWPNNT